MQQKQLQDTKNRTGCKVEVNSYSIPKEKRMQSEQLQLKQNRTGYKENSYSLPIQNRMQREQLQYTKTEHDALRTATVYKISRGCKVLNQTEQDAE